MKTIFQTLLLSGMLLIILDLSSCRRLGRSSETLVSGQLINLLTNEPIHGVAIELNAQDYLHSKNNKARQKVYSDSQGNFYFAFDALPEMNYELRVDHGSYELVNPSTSLKTGSNNFPVLYVYPKQIVNK